MKREHKHGMCPLCRSRERQAVKAWGEDASPVPCRAGTTAVLGVPEPSTVRCGLLADHEGRHEFRIEWA